MVNWVVFSWFCYLRTREKTNRGQSLTRFPCWWWWWTVILTVRRTYWLFSSCCCFIYSFLCEPCMYIDFSIVRRLAWLCKSEHWFRTRATVPTVTSIINQSARKTQHEQRWDRICHPNKYQQTVLKTWR